MDRSPMAPFCPSFRSAPAPGLLFLSGAHRRVLDAILAGLAGERPVLVLTGESGTGKTVLAQQAGLSCPGRHPARIGASRAQLIDLHHQLPKALGLAPSPAFDDPATGPQVLARACRDSGRRHLLIVDEAQGLPDAGLAWLDALTGAPGDIALLLVGGAGLDALLARSDHDRLRARILGRFRLPPLDEGETAAYVAHRFRVAGCACHAGVQVFDDAAIRHLHALSGGIPRVINHLVQSCLFEAGTAGRKTLDGAFVQACLAALIQDGRLAHLIGPAPAPPVPRAPGARLAPVRDSPAPTPPDPAPPDPAPPDPATARRRGAPSVRAGAAALLAGVLTLVPGRDPGVPQMGAIPLGLLTPIPAPLSRRVPVADPPVPDRLLAQGLALGGVDPARAARLYARAALWGNARAAYYLGQLHETGEGVDPDRHRARAWYAAAAGIDGAASRLAALSASLPQPAAALPVPAPVPVLHLLFGTGQTELHWQGPSGAAGFRVEFVPAGGGPVRQMDTPLPAALIPQPVAAWRVRALRGDGTPGPASAWSRLDPGAR